MVSGEETPKKLGGPTGLRAGRSAHGRQLMVAVALVAFVEFISLSDRGAPLVGLSPPPPCPPPIMVVPQGIGNGRLVRRCPDAPLLARTPGRPPA